MSKTRCASLFGLLLVLSVLYHQEAGWAQSPADQPRPTAGTAWTFEEAMAQQQLYPDDVCLQYIAMKVAQRQGLNPVDTISEWQQLRNRAQVRFEGVDLFTIFSGSLAVQESLQLDAMQDRRAERAEEQGKTVAISTLTGPTVKSHPWQEMLGDRKPEISPLASFVPEDQYYITFRSVSKMLDLIETGDLFSAHMLSQAGVPAWKRDTDLQLRRQLAIETSRLARPFYDLVVKEIVLTGSDPFVNEGSDVTLLFRFEQDLVFRKQMELYLAAAEKSVPAAVRKTGEYRGVPFDSLIGADREVHVYSAYPQPGLHVRSNSLVGFQRVIDLIQGKGAPELKSLGESTEFAYIRTLMPTGAAEEDGLIYLSDPFIRRLVGPQLKLTELRRLRCFNHLKIIGHTATLYHSEKGHPAKSLEDLAKADCLPNGFGEGALVCECGGHYSLTKDGMHGQCSHHGHVDRLTPCCEIPLENVTATEAEAYKQFNREYSEYWRTFFDPIAIRVQSTPEKYRVETIVLPLIENSIYQSLSMALGGKPRIQGDNTSSDTILSMDFAIAKDRLLQQSGWEPPPEVADGDQSEQTLAARRNSINNLKMIGLAMHNFHDVYNHFPSAASVDKDGKSLLSWRVQILPYLDQGDLYNQFHHDEPWDSPHNKTLIAKMPTIYRVAGNNTLQPGMTTYVGVVDKDTAFPPGGVATKIGQFTDGTSNSVLAIDADAEQAVIWTKPDDLPLDAEVLRSALHGRFNDGGLVLFCDGSVGGLVEPLNDETLVHLFNIHDGNAIGEVRTQLQEGNGRGNRDPFGLQEMTGGRLNDRDLHEFITKGLGDTYSLHLCDTDPMLDIQMTRLLGQMFGNFNRGRGPDAEIFGIGMMLASINSPVYAQLSLNDVEIADKFIEKLDDALSIVAREGVELGFFRLSKDFYTATEKDLKARTFVLSLGPVRWRFFYSRIGKRLCIASKLPILEELAQREALPPAHETKGSPSHARLTVHRSRWQKLLPTARLGWNESARQSCLDNLGHFEMAQRAFAPAKDSAILNAQAESIYGVRHFCPAGGEYIPGQGQTCSCSLHGTAAHPVQPSFHETTGVAQKFLSSFTDARIMLTFLEDGLHAVVEIDRAKPEGMK
jgi:hypothetical protein